jgi:hypothetical protein
VRTTRLVVASGILGSAALVMLGLVTPFGDPLRDQVDNALLVLGALGLLNAWLAGRAKLLTETNGVRAALALFALLSAMALALADFGPSRQLGWGVKALGALVLGLVIADVVRRSSST